MASVRIYQKKEARLDRLNVRQEQMFKIGNVGLAAVKNRVAAARDRPMARPSRSPALRDPQNQDGQGQPPQPELTGDMLRNFLVRTVSENKAKASNSTRKDRIKAWITRRSSLGWCSRRRTGEVVQRPRGEARGMRCALIERSLGGKQR